MMKKLTSALLALTLTLAIVTPADTQVYANQPISVTIDGQSVVFADQAPTIADGRTLVPVAGVFQALGFDVQWNGDTQQATLTRTGDTVIITIGSGTFTTNGTSHSLDVPAQIIGGRTMLPIAAVLRSVGYDVDWQEATRTVAIAGGTAVAVVPSPAPPADTQPDSNQNNEQALSESPYAQFDGLWLFVPSGATTMTLDANARAMSINFSGNSFTATGYFAASRDIFGAVENLDLIWAPVIERDDGSTWGNHINPRFPWHRLNVGGYLIRRDCYITELLRDEELYRVTTTGTFSVFYMENNMYRITFTLSDGTAAQPLVRYSEGARSMLQMSTDRSWIRFVRY